MLETPFSHDALPVEQPAGGRSPIERVARGLDRVERLSDLLAAEGTGGPPVLEFKPPAEFRLSIVMPVFNEEATVREVLARVAALPLDKQIIVVDDCSTDGTRRLLEPLSGAEELHVIYKPRNEGKGAALRTGFAAASGDVIVVQDADLEYDPCDIPRLLEPIVRGEADVVYGSRFLHEKPQDRSLLHRLGNAVLTRASNLLTGLPLTDMETCYKAFRREALEGLTIQQNRFGFEPEVTARLARRGCRIVERPISYHARSYAEGKKIGLRDAWNAFYCIVRYGLAD